MVVFLAQISSLIFGNGDRLDKKSWLKSRDFKAWCLSGENKPKSSGIVLNYFHHMEILGHRKLKGITSGLTWKWQPSNPKWYALLFKRAMVLSISCVFRTPPPLPTHLLPPSPKYIVTTVNSYRGRRKIKQTKKTTKTKTRKKIKKNKVHKQT